MTEADLVQAHRQAKYNRDAVLAAAGCGCFYCQETFPGSAVVAWADRGRTAVCPHCRMDAVLAGQAGQALAPLLLAMRQRWFDRTIIVHQG